MRKELVKSQKGTIYFLNLMIIFVMKEIVNKLLMVMMFTMMQINYQ